MLLTLSISQNHTCIGQQYYSQWFMTNNETDSVTTETNWARGDKWMDYVKFLNHLISRGKIESVIGLPVVGGVILSLWWEGIASSFWPGVSGASVSLWGSSLLYLMHRSHDSLIHFVSDFFHLTLAVKGPSDGLICFNELLKLGWEL